MKPVLFVTNHAPPYRVGAFAALHEREDVAFALVGGDVRHGGGGTADADLPFPARHVAQRDVLALAGVAATTAPSSPGISGRVALPAAHRGARRARVPFVLWATLWAPPAHRRPRAVLPAAAPPLPRRRRDRHLRPARERLRAAAKGARPPVFEAPQAVDTGVLERRRARAPLVRALTKSCLSGGSTGRRGSGYFYTAWRASGSTSTPSRAGSGRRRAVPSPVLRHQRGAARRSAAAGGSPQLLRRQRRCRSAVRPHPRLPRAVGPGRAMKPSIRPLP